MVDPALLHLDPWGVGGYLGGDGASGFLTGVVVGVLLGVAISAVGAPLLGAVRARRARRRQDREDERLLRAFRELSARREPGVPVAVHEVREMAKASGLEGGLDRLLRKGHIVEHPGRWDWFTITEEGRRAATGPRPRGRGAFGG